MAETLRGTLVLAARPAAGRRAARAPAEERLPFASLQELLDLCARHERGGAFVRVEIEGRSGAAHRRLVLDLGQFSAWPEPPPDSGRGTVGPGPRGRGTGPVE